MLIALCAIPDLGCVAPGCDGAFLSREAEDALWQQDSTVAPSRRRPFEPSSKRRKKRPAPPHPGTVHIQVLASWYQPIPGYHPYNPSRRQSSPAITVLVEALRDRGGNEGIPNRSAGG